MSEFDELAIARASVKRFVASHTASVRAFYSIDARSDDAEKDFSGYFKIQLSEQDSRKEKAIRRLTTTYTSAESILESQDARENKVDRAWADGLIREFTERALDHTDLWESEGSAWIYCRARSLGAAARHARDELYKKPEHEAAVHGLLEQMWSSRGSSLGAIGIRERTNPFSDEEPAQGHPANAYLTYWTLYVTKRLGEIKPEFAQPFVNLTRGAADWLRKTLAEQIAYFYAGSTHRDPQQLAWCISGLLLDAEPSELVSGAQTFDLVSQGLRVFFEQQSERGRWSRGKPLFNYRDAGNAYCYTYETLAELLATATDPKFRANAGISRLLRPYWRQLVLAFEYAEETALPLGEDSMLLGWGSNHHPHRPQAESWATASVYRFVQKLRLLLGNWTSDEAMKALGARQAKAGRKELTERGGTWNMGLGSAGLQLSTSYLLPLLADESLANPDIPVDPDDTVIQDTSGRSAILYGPPGTGKTTLVEAIAGALDWPFIEVNPAQFLDQGLDMVSARADIIFRQMMELDRCVVLLDEIDELVQNRTPGTEPLERFFTTTMLPRLAKLWSMGKVMFFANTNNVLGVDSAIRRGQRFDAAILVMPPGWEAKRSILAERQIDLKDEVRKSVEDVFDGKANLTDGQQHLRWYPLARYDQMSTIASALTKMDPAATTEEQARSVGNALVRIGRDLLSQDWFNSKVGDEEKVKEAVDALRAAQRRDAKLRIVLEAEVAPPETQRTDDDRFVQLVNSDVDDLEAWLLKHGFHVDPGGTVSPVQ